MALRSPTAERKRIVTVVYNPEQEKENSLEAHPLRKKRVAAYARVSTEQDEQQSSYENQIEYYTGYIKSKPEWEFVDIYSDEGITGTNLKKRSGFNRMIEDAMNGKIDLILTKSISRFSRNTVDSLSITRQLKAKSVEVYFEKENIPLGQAAEYGSWQVFLGLEQLLGLQKGPGWAAGERGGRGRNRSSYLPNVFRRRDL